MAGPKLDLTRLMAFSQTSEGQQAISNARTDNAAFATVAEASGLEPVTLSAILDEVDTVRRKGHRANTLLARRSVSAADEKQQGGMSARDLLLGHSGGLVNLALLQPLLDVDTLTDEQVTRLHRQLDGSAIAIVPQNAVIDAQPQDAIVLPAHLTRIVVRLREVTLADALVPNLESYNDAAQKSEAIGNAISLAMNQLQRGQGSAEAKELARLSARLEEQFTAFLNPKTGAITLSERSHPLPDAVARRIDSADTRARLARLVTTEGDDETLNGVLDELSTKLPTDVVAALEAAGLTHVRLKDVYGFSTSAKIIHEASMWGVQTALVAGVYAGLHALGVGDAVTAGALISTQLGASHLLNRLPQKNNPIVRAMAQRQTPEDLGILGSVTRNAKKGWLDVATSKHLTPSDTASTMAHEFMHVVDAAGGTLGAFSNEPEFQDIYQDTLSAEEAGQRTPAFPTPYAATDPAEFFAETAIAFLNLQQTMIGATARVATREDLARTNPRAYAYFEKFFAERLPRIVREGQLKPVTAWVNPESDTRDALAEPEATRSPDEWLAVAGELGRQALDKRDIDLLDQALVAAQRAQQGVGKSFLSLRLSKIRSAYRMRAEGQRVETTLNAARKTMMESVS